MPSSSLDRIEFNLRLILAVNPQSLLDVGVGFGKYGFLFREYTEIWQERVYKRKDFTRIVDGVEPYTDYINPVHRFVYNYIYTKPIEDIICFRHIYQLAIFIDVLEHLSLEKGLKVLLDLQKYAASILISVPKPLTRQGAVFGNPLETHRHDWQVHEFPFKEQLIFEVPGSLYCFTGPSDKIEAVRRAIE